MLAVQNPAMGSSRQSDVSMPFGYSFDSNSNFPLPSPTAPAPGPSLLDDSETKYLESFFDGVSNEQFSYDSMFMNAPDGSELGLGWEELPPAFMGTTSSYGPQPVIGNHGLGDQNYANMSTQMHAPPQIPQLPQQTSADVLEAATLLQNGSAGRSHSMAEGALFGAHNVSHSYANGAPRSQSISQFPPSRPSHGLPQRAAGEEFFRHSYYKDMVFGADPAEGARRRQGLQKNIEIQWGSDTRFASPQGYTSTDHQQRLEAERSQMSIVNAFRLDVANIDSSAENTQPSSPNHTRAKSDLANGEDDDSRPRKRRKNKSQDDEDDDEDEEDDFRPSSTSKSATKKRKPAKKNSTAHESPNPEGSESGHKRRKSTAAAASASKAARENLSEEQKRENHIKSEQKRRALIKDGFDDLHELVPNLKGGGFSKSAVLIMAADWLESLLKGNEELRRRLDEMEGRA